MRHSSKNKEIKMIRRAVSSRIDSDSHKIDLWLTAPCLALNNKSPLELINEDQFESLLLKIISKEVKL